MANSLASYARLFEVLDGLGGTQLTAAHWQDIATRLTAELGQVRAMRVAEAGRLLHTTTQAMGIDLFDRRPWGDGPLHRYFGHHERAAGNTQRPDVAVVYAIAGAAIKALDVIGDEVVARTRWWVERDSAPLRGDTTVLEYIKRFGPPPARLTA